MVIYGKNTKKYIKEV